MTSHVQVNGETYLEEPSEAFVVLKLSIPAATALKLLCGRVYGNETDTMMKYTSAIYAGLDAQGIARGQYGYGRIEGSVKFLK